MIILSFKPPHDAALAAIRDGELVFSVEGEKDSNSRFYAMNSFPAALESLGRVDGRPDVIAIGDNYGSRDGKGYESVYFGSDPSLKRVRDLKVLGASTKLFSSSHERAHLLCSYGLSPFPQGQPCYALCWEGGIGNFYRIGPELEIEDYGCILPSPGIYYALPYFVASKNQLMHWDAYGLSTAGKMMALTGFGRRDEATRLKWKPVIDELLRYRLVAGDDSNSYVKFVAFVRKYSFNQIGVESQEFKDFSHHYSEAIFDRFHRFAKKRVKDKLPLLISGGCGLNCDWNTRWKDSGLFSDVFVPPCTNDTGLAIGYAIDALHHFTGQAKIAWSVYAGEDFVHDRSPGEGFRAEPLDLDRVAGYLARGVVFAWVQGRYEIGPRALCNRSLIAAPFSKDMHGRLNRIKQREGFRPIAPVCTEESVSRFFGWEGESPFMLHFMEVRDPKLQAVTHADNTARVQTVRRAQNPQMYELLKRFEEKTGYPVLCNTSLNFKEKGFINRMSDLETYLLQTDVDGMVVGDAVYLKKEKVSA